MFSSNGMTLASASGDQTVCLWDLNDPKRVPLPRTLRGHQHPVLSLALLPDNTRLVSGDLFGTVYFWNISLDRREPSPVILTATLNTWCFGPDSKSVLTIDRQGRAPRWRGANFKTMEPLLEAGTNTLGVCVSDDGRLLAAGSSDGAIHVWDFPRRSLLHRFTAHTGPVRPWQFLEQRKKLAILRMADRSVQEWDLATLKKARSWPSPNDTEANPNRDIRKASDVAFSPNGKLFAAASPNGLGTLWETAT